MGRKPENEGKKAEAKHVVKPGDGPKMSPENHRTMIRGEGKAKVKKQVVPQRTAIGLVLRSRRGGGRVSYFGARRGERAKTKTWSFLFGV